MNFLNNLFGKSESVKDLLNKGAVIVDVRTPQEYETGHIKGSKNIPLDALQSRVDELKNLNKVVITVCRSGMRSNSAKTFLQGQGLHVVNGGAWTNLNKIA